MSALRPQQRERRRVRERRFGLRTLLPQILTTGNLGAGFFSITRSAGGDYDMAALAIVFAIAFDIADGRVARFAHTESRFGAEYDSIADTVSFGVAPALLAYGAGGLAALGWTGWVLASLFTACAGLRLARFNLGAGRYRGWFDGLSTPAAAGVVLSTVWFAGLLRDAGLAFALSPWLPALGVALLGVLMVSSVPYYSFKALPLHRPLRTPAGNRALMVLAFALIMSKPSLTFFLFGMGYLVSGPLLWLWRRHRGLELEAVGTTEMRSQPAPARAEQMAPRGDTPQGCPENEA